MALAQHVHAEHAELAGAMLSTLWGMFEGWGLTDMAAIPATEVHSPDSGMQAAGDRQTLNHKYGANQLVCGRQHFQFFCQCIGFAAH